MDIMISTLINEISTLNTRLRKVIETADPACQDWMPGPGTNSLAILAAHSLGSQLFWISTAVGTSVARDREAEFRTAGQDKQDLLARIDEVNAKVKTWLERTDSTALATSRIAHGKPVTATFCVMHATTHLAEHVGHAELTAQLWALRG